MPESALRVRSYRYRAYPSASQEEAYDKQAAGVRYAYNFMVNVTDQHNRALISQRRSGMKPEIAPAGKPPWSLRLLRQNLDFRWKGEAYPLSEICSVAVASATGDDLNRAWKTVRKHRVRGLKAEVHFRKHFEDISLVTASGSNVPSRPVSPVSTGHALVKLPRVFGGNWKIRLHRQLPADADILSIRVKRSQGDSPEHGQCYMIIFTVRTALWKRPAAAPGTSVGIDRGINLQFALDDGRYGITPGLDAAEREQYRLLEQQLARQRRRAQAEHAERCTVPGCRRKWHPSRRYLRTLAALRALRNRESDRMRDALHKATRRLADEFEILVFEDLNLPGMTKSAKGTMEEPGRNVRAKSGLNRELLAACLGKIPVMAALKEARVVVVDPRNTSRLCPECGSTDAANRSSTRFLCISCGYEADADVNAARNIRERWSTQSGSADRSQSACARETGKMRDDFLVPAEWGRSVARKRLSFHRSSAG